MSETKPLCSCEHCRYIKWDATIAQLREERDNAITARIHDMNDGAHREQALREGLADRQRLWDLVRQCRHKLFEEELISDDEFARLVEDHPAVARLETYDEMAEWRVKAGHLEMERDQARNQIAKLREVLTKSVSAMAENVPLPEAGTMIPRPYIRKAELEALADALESSSS